MGSEGAQAPGTHIPDVEWGKVTAQAVQGMDPGGCETLSREDGKGKLSRARWELTMVTVTATGAGHTHRNFWGNLAEARDTSS